ncbi:MAG: hypothetical protein WBP45_04555 [Daejeonella sp.]
MIDLKEYLPLLTVLISLTALVIAIYNVRIAKDSFKVNRKQFQNKLPNFEFYLIDSFCITLDKERLLIYHITISNKSETKNSFSPALFLEYYDNENVSNKIKLKHSPELSDKIKKQPFTFFPEKIFLSDRESISKWLIFRYNIDITKGKRIDNYILNIRDINGNQNEVSIILMKELL